MMKTDVYIVLLLFVGVIHCQQRSTTFRPTVTRASSNNIISDDSLRNISSELYSLDVNGVYGQLELNLQNKTFSGSQLDKASRPLFAKAISPDVLAHRPTYAKLLKLFDNYEAAVNVSERVTNEELAEESAFLDAILATDVMKTAHRYLVGQKLADAKVDRFKSQLRNIWFGLYSRAAGKAGSSGFEHIFLGEWKNGISGLHSWIRYQQEEAKGHINYLGYIKTLPIGQSAVGLIELPMEWDGIYKPFNTLSIGTSPELDMALYTICFLAKPDSSCQIQGPPGINRRSTRYRIQSFTSTYRGEHFIGSAFPAF